uniref:Delta-like protein n=1 Tax=Rodentolepis nana TaxID=102285 RepID=A0A0R3TIK5_RODNA
LERECYNVTCASFASCGRVDEHYACMCDGVSGKRCEEGFDPCAEHVCLHGGTCVPIGEHMNFAKCVNCSGRRGGLHCEEELNACEYEESQLGHPPCTNGGHCVVSPFNETQFTCLCAPGWRGAHCEIPFNGTRRGDACDLETFRLGHSPCANGGHCVADTSNETTFSCLCAQGWQGPTCEVSSFKVSAVVVVLSVLLLFLTIGCIMGVVCYLRIFTVPKMRYDLELPIFETQPTYSLILVFAYMRLHARSDRLSRSKMKWNW